MVPTDRPQFRRIRVWQHSAHVALFSELDGILSKRAYQILKRFNDSSVAKYPNTVLLVFAQSPSCTAVKCL